MEKSLFDRVNQLKDRLTEVEGRNRWKEQREKVFKKAGEVGPDDSPAALAKRSIAAIRAFPDQEPSCSVEAACEAIKGGDLTLAEELLTSQALVLNALFNQSVQVASMVIAPGGSDPTFPERYMKLALKAQEQSRKTLQTLADLKHPKRQTIFIKNQQNLLQLEQQQQHALKEGTYAPLDIGSTTEATASNPTVEAVGAIERPQDARRKSPKRSK